MRPVLRSEQVGGTVFRLCEFRTAARPAVPVGEHEQIESPGVPGPGLDIPASARGRAGVLDGIAEFDGAFQVEGR